MNILKKEEEKLPGYFADIHLQKSKSFMGALEYICNFDSKSILRLRNKIKDLEDVSLMKILKDNNLGRKDRERLITFGKVLNNILDYFNINRSYDIVEGNGFFFEVNCGNSTVNIDDSHRFIIRTDNYTTKYIKERNYKNMDNHYTYFDSDCNVHLTKIKKQEEGKNSENEYLFIDEKKDSYDEQLQKHVYNLTNGKYCLLTKITTSKTDMSSLTSNIKNLKFPVDIFSYLSDIGERFALKCSSIYIMQSYKDDTIDSINIIGERNNLDYCKRTISSNESIFIKNNGQFDYNVNYKTNNSSLEYRVIKEENLPISLKVEASGNMIAQVKRGSDIIDDATTAYNKTLEKLPNWVKRN